MNKEQAKSWAVQQRKKRRNGELSNEQISKLNSIGFSWNPKMDKWMEGLEIYKSGSAGPNWKYLQRDRFRRGTLSKKQIELLKGAGFDFRTHEEILHDKWLSNLEEFKAGNNKRWGSKQRDRYKSGRMPKREIDILNSIGFKWYASRKLSNEEFIRRFRNTHGDRYSYDDSGDIKSNQKIKIHCKVHGYFYQIAHDHISGRGCSKCSYKELGMRSAKAVVGSHKDTGEEIWFESMADAIRNGFKDISRAIHKGGTCGGFKWKYYEE